MPIQSEGKSGVLADSGPKISHLGPIPCDMDVKFFLPSFLLILRDKPSLSWTQIDHLSLQNSLKWPYLKIPSCSSVNHQNANCLLHFFMNLYETFRIDVNMDFANTNHGRFLI